MDGAAVKSMVGGVGNCNEVVVVACVVALAVVVFGVVVYGW